MFVKINEKDLLSAECFFQNEKKFTEFVYAVTCGQRGRDYVIKNKTVQKYFNIYKPKIKKVLVGRETGGLRTQKKEKLVKKEKLIFTPPDLLEVEKIFLEKLDFEGAKNEAEKFINYYESNGWMVGKSKMINWKFAVLNWAKRNIEFKKQKENGITAKKRYVFNYNEAIKTVSSEN